MSHLEFIDHISEHKLEVIIVLALYTAYYLFNYTEVTIAHYYNIKWSTQALKSEKTTWKYILQLLTVLHLT